MKEILSNDGIGGGFGGGAVALKVGLGTDVGGVDMLLVTEGAEGGVDTGCC